MRLKVFTQSQFFCCIFNFFCLCLHDTTAQKIDIQITETDIWLRIFSLEYHDLAKAQIVTHR